MVERWSLVAFEDRDDMTKLPNGEWVRFSDHAAELASLRTRAEAAETKLAEAVKREAALEEGLRAWLNVEDSTDRLGYMEYVEACAAATERARALLAKHEGDGL